MTPEQKNELKKKITVLLVLGLVFGVMYNFYAKLPEPKAKLVKKPDNAVEKIKEKTKTEEITVEVTQEFPKVQKKINPSSRDDLARLAAQNIGKQDPFIDTNKKSASLNLPPARHSGINMTVVSDDLPTLSGSLPSPVDFMNQINIVTNEPELKGFIGNKAIVSYKGMSMALSVNQNIDDVRIVDISPRAGKVLFAKQGKKFSKSLKYLDNNDSEILQKLN